MGTRTIAITAALAACAEMTACSRIEEAAMPILEKVNAAYPVAPESKVAQERLQTLLQGDSNALSQFRSQVEARMSIRALTCSKSVSIDRLDSVASVKAKPLDGRCFQEQDKELQMFYGVRTVGLLLAQPPLRPLKALGPISVVPIGKMPSISSGSFARDAAVAVMHGGVDDAAVVEVPGGAVVSQLPREAMVSTYNTKVSPNGRVVCTSSGYNRGTNFYDAETGHRIWQSTDGSQLLAWLPEVLGFVLAARDGSSLLADGLEGTTKAHPITPRNSSFAVSLPSTPARALIGTSRELSLIDHARSPKGIDATLVKQYTISSGQGVTSGNLIPMRSGKWVLFASMRDIGWLEIASGRSGTWRSSPYFGVPFAKIDETHVMVDSLSDDRMSLKPWSFDIENETVAPIDLGGQRGLLIDTGDRIGFMRRGNEAWVGDQFEAGEARTMESVVADYELQLQLRKLQLQAEADSAAATSALPPNVAAMNGAEAATQAAKAALQLARGVRSDNTLAPGLNDVPADAQVHVVGVYGGSSNSRSSGSNHPSSDIRVTVRGTGRPLVLVLASYEPVDWKVLNSGARIAAVLVSGYHPSTVTGVGGAPVLRIGSDSAYSSASPEYLKLRSAIARYTGPREVRSFQGGYTGTEFTVGGY